MSEMYTLSNINAEMGTFHQGNCQKYNILSSFLIRDSIIMHIFPKA